MTLKQAHKATDKEIARMEKNIRAIYQRASKEMAEKTAEAFAELARKDTIQAARVTAGELTRSEYLEWRERMFLNNSRYIKATERLTQTLVEADKAAIAYTNGQMAGIYALNLNAVNTTIGNIIKEYSFKPADLRMIKRLATENPNLLPLKKVNTKKVVRWAGSKINKELTQGIIQGESIPKIAKRLERVTGMESRYAVTNARTMCTSAENKARLDGMEDAQEQGVILIKEWSAVNDRRTRDWHADLDGETAEIDEPFENEYGKIMYPGDPDAEPANIYNCRCSIETRIIGFRGSNGRFGV